MTIPSIILGILISSLLGAGFHLWLNGSLFRLILFVIASWTGFWIGHMLSNILEFSILRVGPLNLGMGILMNLLVLAIAHWLSQSEKKSEN